MRQLRQFALDNDGVLRLRALLVLLSVFVTSSLGFAALGGWFGIAGIALAQIVAVGGMVIMGDASAISNDDML